jgi:hypothetical protein
MTASLPCFFCSYIAGRQDHLRRHCIQMHRGKTSQLCGFVNLHGLKFHTDALSNPNILFSLKTNGSNQDCGYCMGCCHPISVPKTIPNPTEYIRTHTCRPRSVLPSIATPEAVGGAGAPAPVPAAPPPVDGKKYLFGLEAMECVCRLTDLITLATNIKEKLMAAEWDAEAEQRARIYEKCKALNTDAPMLILTMFRGELDIIRLKSPEAKSKRTSLLLDECKRYM